MNPLRSFFHKSGAMERPPIARFAMSSAALGDGASVGQCRLRCPLRAMHPMHFRHSLAVLTAVASIAACTSVNPYYDPSIPHRAADGFRNNHPVMREGDFWKWQLDRWRDGLPKPPANGY